MIKAFNWQYFYSFVLYTSSLFIERRFVLQLLFTQALVLMSIYDVMSVCDVFPENHKTPIYSVDKPWKSIIDSENLTIYWGAIPIL